MLPSSPDLSNLTGNSTYLTACRLGGSLVDVEDIPFWPPHNASAEPDDASGSQSSAEEGPSRGDEDNPRSKSTVEG